MTTWDVHAELLIDGVWTDTLTRAGASITRGRGDYQSEVEASTCSVVLDNVTGRYTPTNPVGPYYGKIGRNTQFRVRVGADVRFHGEVSSWPVVWSQETDVQTRIEAAGILRRLSRSSTSLRSALYRYLTSGGLGVPLWSYWPCEDSAGSTHAASAVQGVNPMNMIGTVTFASGDGPGGSDKLPSIAAPGVPANVLRAFPPRMSMTVGDGWSVYLWFRGEGTTAQISPVIVHVDDLAFSGFRVTAENTAPATVNLDLLDRNNNIVDTATVTADVLDGDWHLITVSATSDVVFAAPEVTLWVDAVSDTATPGGLNGNGMGPPTIITTPSLVTQTNISTAQAGQILVLNQVATSTIVGNVRSAGSGFVGETAGARLTRLCAEFGIAFTLVGTAADSAAMGAQRIAAKLDLLTDCANADMGILYEPRDSLSLAYRTLRSMYNQTPSARLYYDREHLHVSLNPTDDDQKTRNIVTASRVNGSSATVQVDDGAMSTQDPPTGAGPYSWSTTVNVADDDQLEDVAGWHVRLGTSADPRWPQLTVKLDGPGLDAGTISALTSADLGDMISVDNLPVWAPPGVTTALLQGCTEDVDKVARTLTLTTSPATPYTVGAVDTLGSELAVAVSSSATSMNIATTGTSTVSGYPAPRWTTSASDMPIACAIGGEQISVTGVSNGTWTRIGVGTAASDGNAAGTSTITPALHASTAAGDLILVTASIRNSGAGVPDTPSGWLRTRAYPADSNVQIFARIAPASPAAPLISFSGGVANATLVGQSVTYRSSTALYNVNNLLIHAASVLNASATDIIYPDCPVPEDNCLIIVSGWRQQDWTSVATLAGGFAEIGEPDEGLGDNAGIVWDDLVQTSRADITGGSFVVTGGIAGISRGAVLVLRSDIQTFTVARAQNGVSKSQTVATALRLWTPAVVGV